VPRLPIADGGPTVTDRTSTPRPAYNSTFARQKSLGSTMEAEQLNQIANTLAGLRDREAQLRRYL
jgi:hypothetical protein